jgi:hypothetical protein
VNTLVAFIRLRVHLQGLRQRVTLNSWRRSRESFAHYEVMPQSRGAVKHFYSMTL